MIAGSLGLVFLPPCVPSRSLMFAPANVGCNAGRIGSSCRQRDRGIGVSGRAATVQDRFDLLDTAFHEQPPEASLHITRHGFDIFTSGAGLADVCQAVRG